MEKDDLFKAGLGEKEICFNLDMEADSFRQVLFDHYQNLQNGGGFEFFKCHANTRKLEKLSSACLSSPAVLKRRAGSSTTYIRPFLLAHGRMSEMWSLF